MKFSEFELGVRIQQMLCLAVIFGVLWLKEYLWTAFTLAIVLYVWDSLLVSTFRAALNSPSGPTAPERTRPRRGWASEEATESDVDGGEDFREPPPSRSPPRKR